MTVLRASWLPSGAVPTVMTFIEWSQLQWIGLPFTLARKEKSRPSTTADARRGTGVSLGMLVTAESLAGVAE
jgi:hypothetical protein